MRHLYQLSIKAHLIALRICPVFLIFFAAIIEHTPVCAQQTAAQPEVQITSQPIDTTETIKTNQLDKSSLGFGLGLDMGGIGAQLLVYPQRNFGLFLGGGYAVAGAGVNAGLKTRLLGPEHSSPAIPFWLVMYGVNAGVVVSNATRFNKTFNGITIGGGVDIRTGRKLRNYMAVAILVPFRTTEAKEYLGRFSQGNNKITQEWLPIALSIGYHINLDGTNHLVAR
jgi:hypothetical protein